MVLQVVTQDVRIRADIPKIHTLASPLKQEQPVKVLE